MSNLDAEIVNRKLTRYLLKLKVTEKDNFDLVEYHDEEDGNSLESIFSLYEQYVIYDVFKLTGVTLTEFKQMTAIEKNVFLEYLFYKTDLLNLTMDNAEDNLNNLEDGNPNPMDDLYRHSGF